LDLNGAGAIGCVQFNIGADSRPVRPCIINWPNAVHSVP